MSTIIGGTGYASYGTAMPTYGAASYGTAMPTYGASYGATPTYGGYGGGYGAHPMDAATVNRAVSSTGCVFSMRVFVFVYVSSMLDNQRIDETHTCPHIHTTLWNTRKCYPRFLFVSTREPRMYEGNGNNLSPLDVITLKTSS